MDICFLFSSSNTWKWNDGSIQYVYVYLFKKLSKWFPKQLYHSAFSLGTYESSSFFASSPKHGVVSHFCFTLSVRYVVVSNVGCVISFMENSIEHVFMCLLPSTNL